MKKLILSTLLSSLILSPLSALNVTQEEKITGLYIATFKRAADHGGLNYWKTQSDKAVADGKDQFEALKELSDGFSKHDVFTVPYSGLSNQAFVEAIYVNTLGKAGDTGGINYWTTELNNGMSRSDMVAYFINAVLSVAVTEENYPTLTSEELAVGQQRQNLILNKVEVALTFTNSLHSKSDVKNVSEPEDDSAYIASMKIVQGVTEDQETLTKALVYLNSIIDNASAIEKINDEFKWIEDIIVRAGESKICTQTTPFNAVPTNAPIVTFVTDNTSSTVTTSVANSSLGFVTLANCTLQE